MKRILSALAVMGAASLLAAGCGDDDDSASPNDNTAGAPGGAGAPSGNVACDPTQAGVCQNDMDCPFVADGTARLTAGDCGKGCINKPANCARDCITMMLDMTGECAGCYADAVNCLIQNCVGECFADPESDGCKKCQVDSLCRAAFDTCSGLPE
jgi:hypothetical protein